MILTVTDINNNHTQAYLSLFHACCTIKADVQVAMVVEKSFEDIQHFCHLSEDKHPSIATKMVKMNPRWRTVLSLKVLMKFCRTFFFSLQRSLKMAM